MKKELIGIFVCILLIATVALPVSGILTIKKENNEEENKIIAGIDWIGVSTDENILNNLKFQRNYKKNIIKDRDELDQYQIGMDSYGYIGRDSDSLNYYIVAQQFIPTKGILTRVELMVCKNVTTLYNLTVAIKDNLSESNLISISQNPDSIPTEIFSWIEFDFDNIKVTPGNSYYIVCSTIDSPNNRYAWGVKMDNVYPNGSIYWSKDGQKWYYDTGLDAAFKTYGRDNNPPNAPTITGETNGKTGAEYEYNFKALDPDEDNVKYYIDWDDGKINITEFYPSDLDVKLKHTWSNNGFYNITAMAVDVYSGESQLGTLKVQMPRNKANIGSYWLRFLDMFPILQRILNFIR
jgi:hypothetical protein